MIRRPRYIYYILVPFLFSFVFILTFLSLRHPRITSAVSTTNFDPGYIISDYQMENYQSMTVDEIKTFLLEHGNCRDTDIWKASQAPNDPSYFHIRDGHFVCMAEEIFGTGVDYGDDVMDGRAAAQIIYDVSQEYHINPQVLIVLLEKEQGLVSDSFPNKFQYRIATGYGCPDTAPCEEKYYGFRNQLSWAADLFRTVLDGGWTNFPLGEDYIQYNPDPACGGSVVNVKNLATSALYRYTPYQPNAAALAAGYGGNVPCGAYGNRNFYLLFNDWFGDSKMESPTSPEEDPPVDPLGAISGNMNTVPAEKSDGELTYAVSIKKYGQLGEVSAGEMAGTTGLSLGIETISINSEEVDVDYRAHVQDIGWQDWKKNGELAGMNGKRLEAIEIILPKQYSVKYDILYRVHIQDIGWQDWKKNGELAGTTGQSKQIEAIQIKLTKKSLQADISSRVHVQDVGWQDWKKNGELAGTTGQSLRLEAIEIKLPQELAEIYDLSYRVHVQDIGWQDWKKNGELAGTTGQSRRLEAIEIKLPQELAEVYDLSYRVHVQDIGWQDWKKNGELAGTTGQSKRLEAIEIKLLPK